LNNAAVAKAVSPLRSATALHKSSGKVPSSGVKTRLLAFAFCAWKKIFIKRKIFERSGTLRPNI
jgi:hypothetical protein